MSKKFSCAGRTSQIRHSMVRYLRGPTGVWFAWRPLNATGSHTAVSLYPVFFIICHFCFLYLFSCASTLKLCKSTCTLCYYGLFRCFSTVIFWPTVVPKIHWSIWIIWKKIRKTCLTAHIFRTCFSHFITPHCWELFPLVLNCFESLVLRASLESTLWSTKLI
jgi:hypothetical protein